MPVLVDNQIDQLIAAQSVKFDRGVTLDGLVQPSSVDLPISIKHIYQVPGEPDLSDGQDIETFVNRYGRLQGPDKNKVQLDKGSAYVAKVSASLRFDQSTWAIFNPKSTTGRNGLHTKVVCCSRYDEVPKGYQGSLWVFIGPRAFNVRISDGTSLVQMRVVDGERWFIDKHNLTVIDRQTSLTVDNQSKLDETGLILSLSVDSEMPMAFARNTGRVMDWNDKGLDPFAFFCPKVPDEHGVTYLETGDFVLACTKELIRVPEHVCAELLAFNPANGELRTHDAGFFDPNFGGQDGSTTVCEITNLGPTAVQIKDGRVIASLRFEHLAGTPTTLYGEGGSHYQGQKTLRFAKQLNSQAWPPFKPA